MTQKFLNLQTYFNVKETKKQLSNLSLKIIN